MKRILIAAVATAILCSCAYVPVREGVSGTPSTVVYNGDCVDDHWDSYFDCAALQGGGSDE